MIWGWGGERETISEKAGGEFGGSVMRKSVIICRNMCLEEKALDQERKFCCRN